MIKATELRIGNWLLTKLNDSGLVKIDSNHIAHIEKGNEFNYEPIPLTPEILEGCGFVDYSQSKNGMGYRLRFGDGRELAWYIQDNYLRYQTTGSGFTTQLTHIKYLHQLMNFYFALTGQELTVNLPIYKDSAQS